MTSDLAWKVAEAIQHAEQRNIVPVAEELPPTVVQGYQKLMLWYDLTVTRTAAS